ncbi:MAG TPA: hypothetical protein VF730_06650 [Terracidiphilus sp.]
MAIRIQKVSESSYTARLLIPDMPAVKAAWSTCEPMTVDQLFEELVDRGAHQVDIEDAIADADRQWTQNRKEK